MPQHLGGELVLADHALAPCFILAKGVVDTTTPLAGAFLAGSLLGLPFNAISFMDERAVALAFDTGFFNAPDFDSETLARALMDNYDFPGGMEARQTGWRGITSREEIVSVGDVIGVAAMIAFMATDANTPSFD